jgi:hypothetical protein
MEYIADAYMRLTNAKIAGLNYSETQHALKEIQSISKELHSYLIAQLNARSFKPDEVKNVNHRTLPQMTNLWLNMTQYAQRFCFSDSPGAKIVDENGAELINQVDYKIMNLTAFCNIVGDFVQAAESANVDSYYKDIVEF